jgi:hypothetical protein
MVVAVLVCYEHWYEGRTAIHKARVDLKQAIMQPSETPLSLDTRFRVGHCSQRAVRASTAANTVCQHEHSKSAMRSVLVSHTVETTLYYY